MSTGKNNYNSPLNPGRLVRRTIMQGLLRKPILELVIRPDQAQQLKINKQKTRAASKKHQKSRNSTGMRWILEGKACAHCPMHCSTTISFRSYTLTSTSSIVSRLRSAG